jgi:multiple sugar transport system permease protein
MKLKNWGNMCEKLLKEFVNYSLLIFFAFCAIFPIYWIFSTSLRPPRELFERTPSLFFVPTFDNYKELFLPVNPVFRALVNSFIITITTTLLVTFLGMMTGYGLARFKIKYKENFFFFVLTTRVAPPAAFAVPFYIMYSYLGLFDTIYGMILIYTFVNLSFSVWLMRQFFEELPKECEEAALLDGCSYFETLIKITLPLATPAIIATAIFIFTTTWNEFLFALILTRHQAVTYTAILPGFFGARRVEWELLTSLSTIAFFPPIIFSIIARKYLVRGLTLGLVK